MDDLKDYMTTAEAALELGITRRYVQKLIVLKELPAINVGAGGLKAVHLVAKKDVKAMAAVLKNRKPGRKKKPNGK